MAKYTLEQYLQFPYKIIVRKEPCTDGSECFMAFHPELPGCMSHGDTQEEGCRNLQEAKKLYIETLMEDGQDVPLPHYQMSFTRYSGNNFVDENPMPVEDVKRNITIIADEDLVQDWDVVPAP